MSVTSPATNSRICRCYLTTLKKKLEKVWNKYGKLKSNFCGNPVYNVPCNMLTICFTIYLPIRVQHVLRYASHYVCNMPLTMSCNMPLNMSCNMPLNMSCNMPLNMLTMCLDICLQYTQQYAYNMPCNMPTI